MMNTRSADQPQRGMNNAVPDGGHGVGARTFLGRRSLMRRTSRAADSRSRHRRPPLVLWLMAVLAASGCRHEPEIEFTGNTKPPAVRLIQPQARNIVRVVGQPSFIESYERTSIYPKPTAYIQKWIVDIGDKVKKVDVLATLFAPSWSRSSARRRRPSCSTGERIALAKEVVEVAKADVEAAEARLKEAEAILDKYEAEVDRWDTEVKRLERQVARVVVNPRVLFESTNQLKSSIAARDKAKATIKRAKAELLAARARLAKAQVDVRVAEADPEGGRMRGAICEGLGGLSHAHRPVRRRDLGPQRQHFRLRPTHDRRSHGLLPLARHLAQRRRRADLRGRPSRHRPDLCRYPGTRRQLRQDRDQGERARQGVPRHGAAGHRHAHVMALNMKSRTLRAEVDLPNPDSQLLPGMYAYVKVIIERPDVQALPLDGTCP